MSTKLSVFLLKHSRIRSIVRWFLCRFKKPTERQLQHFYFDWQHYRDKPEFHPIVETMHLNIDPRKIDEKKMGEFIHLLSFD
jgi:hypothetical protein